MEKDDPTGSFVRWQSITIDQLTYVINVILGFSIATIGFQLTLLLNEKFILVSWQKLIFVLSLLFLVASVVFGVLVIINRLRDFRATTKVARKREGSAPAEEIEPYRVLSRALGKKTWCLFWGQIGTFSAGALLIVVSVLASTSHKFL